MTLLRFDSVGGASGDMILGALFDLGADAEHVRSCLVSFDMEDIAIDVEDVVESGMRGKRVSVRTSETHAHRHLSDIQDLIKKTRLPDRASELSLAVFERLARAEAQVHGTTVEKIHFHEVGALDSIVDVVGCCIALCDLGVDGVAASPLPLGRGETSGSHGTMPIPVPATAHLLQGFATRQTDEPFELVTPTGAALLTAWQEQMKVPEQADAAEVCTRTGIGFGHRQLDNRPNLLRARLIESGRPTDRDDECLVIECNVDDTTPELIGAVCERLLKGGVFDVFTSPVYMKKNRPGILLTVLCPPAKRPTAIDTLFSETTTFGVREYLTARTMLTRRHETVNTPYGTVRIKIGTWKDADVTRSPEYADCARLADQNKISVRTVYEAACALCRRPAGAS